MVARLSMCEPVAVLVKVVKKKGGVAHEIEWYHGDKKNIE
jgi:hypothetical protein